MPLVTKGKIQRGWIRFRINLRQIRLRILLERRNRSDIAAVVLNRPSGFLQHMKWNSGIILQDHVAVAQQKIAHSSEMIPMQKVRSSFEQTGSATLFLAKLQKTRD